MISYYDLLGMIKDGKIPNKIECKGFMYIWKDESYCSADGTDDFLTDNLNEIEMCGKNIKIIEFGKIKKLKMENGKVIGKWNNGSDYCYTLSAPQTVIVNKINEIIEVLNEKEKIQNNQK